MTEETITQHEEQPEIVENTQIEEDLSDKLPNREALQKAIEEHRKPEATQPEQKEQPVIKEVKQAVEADLEPPAEFSAEAKKAWREKDFKGVQKEYDRLNRSRVQEITRLQQEAKREREEARIWKEIGDKVKPYIEAKGKQGVTPDVAIMQAIALVDAIKSENPQKVKEQLKALKIDLDSATNSNVQIPDEIQEKINHLQKEHEALKQERDAEKFRAIAQTFESIFQDLSSQKTRTGESVFPDLLDSSEAGIQFATQLGSLTRDPVFQQGVLRRFPDADLKVIVREAYKYLGGKVAGEPVKVSVNNNNQHIERSRRAAASTPSRTATRNDQASLTGKLSNRAALARAIAEHLGK